MLQLLEKLEINLPQDPAVTLLDIYSKVTPTYFKVDYLLIYTLWDIIPNNQNLQTTWMFFNQRMDKENVIHMHSGVLTRY